jgi:hypothetical protein
MVRTASPLKSISRPVAAGPGGDVHTATNAITRNQIGTTTVRVVRSGMRDLAFFLVSVAGWCLYSSLATGMPVCTSEQSTDRNRREAVHK